LKIFEDIALVSEILNKWKPELGVDHRGYENHVNRMIRFCFMLHDWNEKEQTKIIIAACFHDLGIWTHNTFDYIQPSISLAEDYLQENKLKAWTAEISTMIESHHKLTPYENRDLRSVEIFRQADLIDVTLGCIRFGLTKDQVRGVKRQFPNAEFHKRLAKLIFSRFTTHPFKPFPMVKW